MSIGAAKHLFIIFVLAKRTINEQCIIRKREREEEFKTQYMAIPKINFRDKK